MSGEILSSTVSVDQKKMLAAKLLRRAYLKLFALSVCEKVPQEKGTGTTGTFVRYTRMALPIATLTEGVPPSNSAVSAETVTSSLDQWGDAVTISDVAQLTTAHPLVAEAQKLLADNAARVMDREVQIVMMAGTSVQYGDASVTTRGTITQSMVISGTIIEKATLTLSEGGAETRTGPSNMKEQASPGPLSGSLRNGQHYIAVCGGQVVRDLRAAGGATGLWQSVSQYQNAKQVYAGEVGDFLGLRIVETNFIPKFARLGNKTAAVNPSGGGSTSDAGGITGLTLAHTATGGSLASAGGHGWKVTRKNLQRGFEEDISMIHTTTISGASGDNEKLTFTFPATSGYVYNLYFTNSASDQLEANMKLVQANILPSAAVAVTDLQATGAAPPPSNRVAGGDSTDPTTIHPVFILGKEALAYVGLQDLKVYVVKGSDKTDPLDQTTVLGYKFMSKAVILDQARILRLELASAF